MFVFIETKLFTRLFDEIFSDDDLAELQDFLRTNLRPETSFQGQAECERCVGRCLGAANEAGSGSFTT
jgi:hypothetical protein